MSFKNNKNIMWGCITGIVLLSMFVKYYWRAELSETEKLIFLILSSLSVLVGLYIDKRKSKKNSK